MPHLFGSCWSKSHWDLISFLLGSVNATHVIFVPLTEPLPSHVSTTSKATLSIKMFITHLCGVVSSSSSSSLHWLTLSSCDCICELPSNLLDLCQQLLRSSQDVTTTVSSSSSLPSLSHQSCFYWIPLITESSTDKGFFSCSEFIHLLKVSTLFHSSLRIFLAKETSNESKNVLGESSHLSANTLCLVDLNKSSTNCQQVQGQGTVFTRNGTEFIPCSATVQLSTVIAPTCFTMSPLQWALAIEWIVQTSLHKHSNGPTQNTEKCRQKRARRSDNSLKRKRTTDAKVEELIHQPTVGSDSTIITDHLSTFPLHSPTICWIDSAAWHVVNHHLPFYSSQFHYCLPKTLSKASLVFVLHSFVSVNRPEWFDQKPLANAQWEFQSSLDSKNSTSVTIAVSHLMLSVLLAKLLSFLMNDKATTISGEHCDVAKMLEHVETRQLFTEAFAQDIDTHCMRHFPKQKKMKKSETNDFQKGFMNCFCFLQNHYLSSSSSSQTNSLQSSQHFPTVSTSFVSVHSDQHCQQQDAAIIPFPFLQISFTICSKGIPVPSSLYTQRDLVTLTNLLSTSLPFIQWPKQLSQSSRNHLHHIEAGPFFSTLCPELLHRSNLRWFQKDFPREDSRWFLEAEDSYPLLLLLPLQTSPKAKQQHCSKDRTVKNTLRCRQIRPGNHFTHNTTDTSSSSGVGILLGFLKDASEPLWKECLIAHNVTSPQTINNRTEASHNTSSSLFSSLASRSLSKALLQLIPLSYQSQHSSALFALKCWLPSVAQSLETILLTSSQPSFQREILRKLLPFDTNRNSLESNVSERNEIIESILQDVKLYQQQTGGMMECSLSSQQSSLLEWIMVCVGGWEQ